MAVDGWGRAPAGLQRNESPAHSAGGGALVGGGHGPQVKYVKVETNCTIMMGECIHTARSSSHRPVGHPTAARPSARPRCQPSPRPTLSAVVSRTAREGPATPACSPSPARCVYVSPRSAAACRHRPHCVIGGSPPPGSGRSTLTTSARPSRRRVLGSGSAERLRSSCPAPRPC